MTKTDYLRIRIENWEKCGVAAAAGLSAYAHERNAKIRAYSLGEIAEKGVKKFYGENIAAWSTLEWTDLMMMSGAMASDEPEGK